jgi:hypothetical protein
MKRSSVVLVTLGAAAAAVLAHSAWDWLRAEAPHHAPLAEPAGHMAGGLARRQPPAPRTRRSLTEWVQARLAAQRVYDRDFVASLAARLGPLGANARPATAGRDRADTAAIFAQTMARWRRASDRGTVLLHPLGADC